MFLRRLELNGFKSFAHATVLELEPGFTAVVGPNGSGKSNVVDAIRWVLGEQSMKRVRSSEGADLIFSGSEGASRKGRASVRLVFDNADASLPVDAAEVEVERSVSRDGNSSFRINRDNVRLTDIVELLAHGNVGHRSTAVINQGMEAEMLRAGPIELRDILEESSGVKPLQIKRRRAERRLRSAHRHADEAQTILREMRPHLRFLEQQMHRVTALHETNREIVALQAKLQQYRTEVLEQELAGRDSAIADLDSELREQETKLKQLEAEERKEETGDTDHRDFTKKFKERRTTLEHRRRVLEREIAKIEARVEIEQEVASSTGSRAERSVVEYRDFLRSVIEELRAVIGSDEPLNRQYQYLRELVESLEHFIENPEDQQSSATAGISVAEEMHTQQQNYAAELKEVSTQLATLHDEEAHATRQWRERFMKRTKAMRARENAVRDLREKRRDTSWQRGRLQELAVRIDDVLSSGNSDDSSRRGETVAPAGGDITTEQEARVVLDQWQLLEQKYETMREDDDEEIAEEYESVNERVTFYEEQLADIRKTERSLQKTIATLDHTMQEQFAERLAHSNKQFHHYFRLLFGGGKAGLASVETISGDDEEEGEKTPAEAGLVIQAQLPGKRIDDLTSFSGGEKALTAIALLFAIVSANPPPFLVLDEVDATLDESNAQRFCRLLREFEGETQFLLITHNRETMREADLLYGVTMGGDGQSQVLSLRLDRAEEYAKA